MIRSQVSSNTETEATIVLEVKPDDLTRLALAQRTMHLEIVRSQAHHSAPRVNIGDVMPNYSGVVELRGTSNSNQGDGF